MDGRRNQQDFLKFDSIYHGFAEPERLIRKLSTPDDTLLGMDKAEHRWFPLYESSQGKEYQVKHSIL